ncbi:MAG: hypothetical protein KatS3mg062_0322 [Tepidiforma sp.]|nr:MAG: hypothetical protein KatS3mg062_0322 [Tepidiforma sp.]
MRWFLFPAILAGVVLSGATLFRSADVRAAGPCGTPHDALDPDEQQFIQLIQGWRNQHLSYSTPLQVSGPLNAAAAWFAQWQVENGAPGGHTDGFGRTWVQRALDCGYSGTTSGGTPYAYGSGEGIRAYASSQTLNISAAQAASDITYPGSGVYAETSSSSLPFKCVGAGRASSGDGKRVAWVVIIAQYPAGSPCPGASASAPTPSATSTPTATPTRTPTSTPTPTPSPTPLPRGDGASITLWAGWNLVMPPAGPVEGVLARAAGCYEAVYQFDGSRWLRYIPGGPSYVNSLHVLSGGPAWVKGTAANCGLVVL